MADSNAAAGRLELWGGIECTRNRVGDAYFDQLQWNGHARRPDDLDLIAGLGIRTLRYPVLWEAADSDEGGRFDWSWADRRLGRLRSRGLRPIAGLIHHGSGPARTNLLDPGFADGLARYAGELARRFPWIDAYTPVNEPLTTARFSALYGHWYPHACDGRSFARALLNQCRAVVLAMEAIRSVRDDARLVQTEDLGKTYSRPALAYQADFENERRWLTFDLLCGRVGPDHPMTDHFRWLGIPDADLFWFRDRPCPPDLLGVNHYLTSERFLDDRVDAYPPEHRGGNGRDAYADVEAVRILPDGIAGPCRLILEAWDRFRLPVAVTEAHLGCTREEQLRWLHEVWRGAESARKAGADVRAVTVWSLFGAFDWDSLLTRPRGHYETGVFDIRGGQPRPTALATLARELADGRTPSAHVLGQPGWWHRPERLFGVAPKTDGAEVPGRPLLIAGAAGRLGRAFGRLCAARGLPFRLLTRKELDIADPAQVEAVLGRLNPWAVVNAAGFVRIDEAESRPERCRRENVDGAAVLADACAWGRIPLLTFSTDQVFDGRRAYPYRELDEVAPLSIYGRAKAEAERRVLALHSGAMVVRTGAFFNPWDDANFASAALRAIRSGRPFAAASDAVFSPTYVPDLVHTCLDLLIDGEAGVWHLANPGEVSWATFARQAASLAGLDPTAVLPRPLAEMGLAATRPRYSALASGRALLLPPLEDALGRFVLERAESPIDAVPLEIPACDVPVVASSA